MRSTSVVLPAPDGPVMTVSEPAGITMSASRSTGATSCAKLDAGERGSRA